MHRPVRAHKRNRPRPFLWPVAVLCVLAGFPAAAQQMGGISGMVLDAEFGGGIPQARVRLIELDRQQATEDDGHFVFENVAPGSYTLMIAKSGYERLVRSRVVVVPGRVADVRAELKGEFTEMEELVIRDLNLGDTTTEAGLLSLRESELSLQDSISKDLMSKAGASDAAGALKLVVGASVVDGKYATVRGLSDRYVGTAMNGIRVPSSDPRKRAVHMDVFPAGTIESISVSKTFTPDLPGDYSGGGVNIRTVTIPDEPFFKFSMSRGINRDYTGSDRFVTYEGGGVGDWGRHRGLRDMPAGLATMEEEGLTDKGLTSRHAQKVSAENPHSETHRTYDRIVRSVAPVMGVRRGRVPPNSGLSVSAGAPNDLGDGWRAGAVGAFTYSRKFSARRSDELDRKIAPEGSAEIEDEYFTGYRGTEELKWSMLGAVGFEHEEDRSYSLSIIRNRVATDRAYARIERHNIDELNVGDEWSQKQGIHYAERSLQLLQLKGKHSFEGFPSDRCDLSIDWFGAHNIAEQEEPDVRLFRNVVVKRPDNMFEYQPRPDGASGASEDSSTRIWRNTYEDNSIYGLNVNIPFRMRTRHFGPVADGETAWSDEEGRFSFGWVRDQTRRQYRQNSFYYAFASQQEPPYTGPQRSDFPFGQAGQQQYLAARDAWLAGPEGTAYQQAQQDTAADRELASYRSEDPEELWTDVFTNPDRIGVGDYQDSMYWYLLPRFYDIDYRGEQDLRAGYWMLSLPVVQQLRVTLGGRLEVTDMRIEPESDLESSTPERAFQVPVQNVISNEDSVSTYYTLNGVTREEARAELNEADWLRSVGLVWDITPEMHLRASWSQTIARPTFLELAPVITFDYIDNETVVGNNELQISHLRNYDLRWEWFRRPGEVMAISSFRKTIENPIEKLSFGYLGQDYLLSVNFPDGEVTGMEYEFRRGLDFLPAPFDRLSLGANFTKINATVRVPQQLRSGLSQHGLDQARRDMEGQPEYLLNVNLTYDIAEWGTSIGFFYNRRGDMLKSGAAVGDIGATPNIYLRAMGTSNLSLSQEFAEHWRLRLMAKNLTHPTVEEIYRYPDGTETTRRRYKEGVEYSFSMGCSW